MIASACTQYPLSLKKFRGVFIIDYDQKIPPQGHEETHKECFGKVGMSLFGGSLLMPASEFSHEDKVSMLGELRT